MTHCHALALCLLSLCVLSFSAVLRRPLPFYLFHIFLRRPIPVLLGYSAKALAALCLFFVEMFSLFPLCPVWVYFMYIYISANTLKLALVAIGFYHLIILGLVTVEGLGKKTPWIHCILFHKREAELELFFQVNESKRFLCCMFWYSLHRLPLVDDFNHYFYQVLLFSPTLGYVEPFLSITVP